MYPARGGFRNAVTCVRLLPAHPRLEDAGIVLDQFPYRLAAIAPHPRKLTDAVVLLERGVFGLHGNLVRQPPTTRGGR